MTATARIVQLLLLASSFAACGGGAEDQPAAQTPETETMAPDAGPVDAAALLDASPPPPKPSMLEMQHAVEKALIANVSDAKKTAALYASDAVVWTPGSPETKGRDAIQKSLEDFNGLFSNLATADQRVWTHGNTIAIHFVSTGTDKASGKPVGGNGLEVLTLNDDGLIASDHTYYDLETLLQQTGAYKSTVRAIPAVPPIAAGSAGIAPEWHDAKSDATETSNVANVQALNAAWVRKEDKVYFGSFGDAFAGRDFAGDPAKVHDLKSVRASVLTQRKSLEGTERKDVNLLGIGDFTVDEEDTTFVQKNSKKSVAVHSVEVDQWKDGKLVASWIWSNGFELDAQLGTGPATQAKSKAAANPAKH